MARSTNTARRSARRRRERAIIVCIFGPGLLGDRRGRFLEKAALEVLGNAIDDGASAWAWQIARIAEGRKGEIYIEFTWHPAAGDKRRPLPRGVGRWSVADFGRYRSTCTLLEDFEVFRGNVDRRGKGRRARKPSERKSRRPWAPNASAC